MRRAPHALGAGSCTAINENPRPRSASVLTVSRRYTRSHLPMPSLVCGGPSHACAATQLPIVPGRSTSRFRIGSRKTGVPRFPRHYSMSLIPRLAGASGTASSSGRSTPSRSDPLFTLSIAQSGSFGPGSCSISPTPALFSVERRYDLAGHVGGRGIRSVPGQGKTGTGERE